MQVDGIELTPEERAVFGHVERSSDSWARPVIFLGFVAVGYWLDTFIQTGSALFYLAIMILFIGMMVAVSYLPYSVAKWAAERAVRDYRRHRQN
jgi:hypothetical protein